MVVNCVADIAAAQQVAADIHDIGGRASVVKADVSAAEEVRALFAAAESLYGPVDILVNNAGLARYAPIGEYDEKDFDRLFDVNVKGTFLTCREAAGRLAPGGTIINITSTVTRVMLPRYGVYAATKAAVEQLTRALAKELGEQQITVNAVAPGPTDTALFRHGKSEAQITAMGEAAALQADRPPGGYCRCRGVPGDARGAVDIRTVSTGQRWVRLTVIFKTGLTPNGGCDRFTAFVARP